MLLQLGATLGGLSNTQAENFMTDSSFETVALRHFIANVLEGGSKECKDLVLKALVTTLQPRTLHYLLEKVSLVEGLPLLQAIDSVEHISDVPFSLPLTLAVWMRSDKKMVPDRLLETFGSSAELGDGLDPGGGAGEGGARDYRPILQFIHASIECGKHGNSRNSVFGTAHTEHPVSKWTSIAILNAVLLPALFRERNRPAEHTVAKGRDLAPRQKVALGFFCCNAAIIEDELRPGDLAWPRLLAETRGEGARTLAQRWRQYHQDLFVNCGPLVCRSDGEFLELSGQIQFSLECARKVAKQSLLEALVGGAPRPLGRGRRAGWDEGAAAQYLATAYLEFGRALSAPLETPGDHFAIWFAYLEGAAELEAPRRAWVEHLIKQAFELYFARLRQYAATRDRAQWPGLPEKVHLLHAAHARAMIRRLAGARGPPAVIEALCVKYAKALAQRFPSLLGSANLVSALLEPLLAHKGRAPRHRAAPVAGLAAWWLGELAAESADACLHTVVALYVWHDWGGRCDIQDLFALARLPVAPDFASSRPYKILASLSRAQTLQIEGRHRARRQGAGEVGEAGAAGAAGEAGEPASLSHEKVKQQCWGAIRSLEDEVRTQLAISEWHAVLVLDPASTAPLFQEAAAAWGWMREHGFGLFAPLPSRMGAIAPKAIPLHGLGHGVDSTPGGPSGHYGQNGAAVRPDDAKVRREGGTYGRWTAPAGAAGRGRAPSRPGGALPWVVGPRRGAPQAALAVGGRPTVPPAWRLTVPPAGPSLPRPAKGGARGVRVAGEVAGVLRGVGPPAGARRVRQAPRDQARAAAVRRDPRRHAGVCRPRPVLTGRPGVPQGGAAGPAVLPRRGGPAPPHGGGDARPHAPRRLHLVRRHQPPFPDPRPGRRRRGRRRGRRGGAAAAARGGGRCAAGGAGRGAVGPRPVGARGPAPGAARAPVQPPARRDPRLADLAAAPGALPTGELPAAVCGRMRGRGGVARPAFARHVAVVTDADWLNGSPPR